MRVSEQIARIQGDKSTIRNQLVAFGLVESNADLDDLATAIEGIENRGAVATQSAAAPRLFLLYKTSISAM